MKKEEIITRQIAPELLEDLRDLPDGSHITIPVLMENSLYSDWNLNDEELILLKKRLFSLGNRDPFRLEFLQNGGLVVHNQLAKYECPNCGSIDTGRILYGTFEITPRLQKKMDSGKIRLSGRDAVHGDADRYCNNCHQEFTVIPWEEKEEQEDACVPQTELGNEMPDELNGIESITFHYDSWGDRMIHIIITRSRNGARLFCREGKYKDPEDRVTVRYISKKAWNNILKTIYFEYRFHEWPEYGAKRLDGTSWRITIQFPDNFVQERRGCNAYPSFWSDLLSLFHAMVA